MRVKLAVAALGAACMMFPAVVHTQCTRSCGFGEGFITSVAVVPTTAEGGQPVTVSVGIINVSRFSPALFRGTVTISSEASACASFDEGVWVSAVIPPSAHRILSYTLSAPQCEATYKVTLNGKGTATLTVN
jgi:hypothetical protein